ncbi:uncharacterized protein [Porites lutea]|uniref:uncharacterized protein n=1 Tax=Porites lutea TaxID=51062 RepID=UPI003CC5BEC0
MEVAGVLTLYKRTPEGIRYSPFVGDGDSKSYSQLEQAAPYGRSFHKPKEDCIAHVTKRMGTNLRKKVAEYKGKKLADGRKGLGGVGGLTTKRIDSMQGWYGQAIRNKGDAKAMSKATHAI